MKTDSPLNPPCSAEDVRKSGVVPPEVWRALEAGEVVSSGRYHYRLVAGRLERLNGWWQTLQWPIDVDEFSLQSRVLSDQSTEGAQAYQESGGQ